MRIRLIKFRQYEDAEFSFEDGQFNFLSGKNSIGKSTIFEAILWCLYGKVQLVTHEERPNDSTTVFLEFAGLKIERQREPVVLRVTNTTNGFELWNTPAQEFLNKKFGHQGAFIATSYIRQGDKHILFETTPGKRMKLLGQIAFLGDNPTEIDEKISAKIKSLEVSFNQAQRQYQNSLAAFNSLVQTNNVDARFILDTDKITQMKTEIVEANIRIVDLRHQRDILMKNTAERECLSKLIKEAEQELSRLPEFSDEDLIRYEDQLKILQEIPVVEKMLSSRRETLTKLDKTDFPSRPPPSFLEEDLTQCVAQFRKSSEMRTKTITLGIKYEPVIIESERESLRATIDCQWMFPVLERYERLKTEYDRLNSCVWKEVTPEIVSQYETYLRSLEQSHDILECPGCHTSLRHVGPRLEMAQGNPFNQEHYDKIRRDCQNAKEHLEMLRKMERLKRDMDEMEIPILPPNVKKNTNVTGLRSKLEQIDNISYVEKPAIEPGIMQACIEWHQINTQIKELTGKLQHLREDVQRFDRDMSVDKILQYKQASIQRKSILTSLESFRTKLVEIPASDISLSQLDSYIEQTVSLIQNLQTSIQKCSISNQAMEQHQIMTKIQQEAVRLQSDIAELNTMKNIVAETETSILQNMINGINQFMKAAVNRLSFEKPLGLEISLFRKMHRSNIEKKVVNFKLRRGNNEFSDFEKMRPCGGEKTCFYMLTAIALNRLTGSPLLILDESFYSLDRANKDELIVLLKELLQGCTVIITCHESNLGHDDRVIKLG